jgi:UDP-2,3-diacylglucosamine hydrolase
LEPAVTPDAPCPFHVLEAPAQWQAIDFISDLHLQAEQPATVAALDRFLGDTDADAVIVLGDLFEAWVGDDAASQPGFGADIAARFRRAAARRPIWFMAGNRDFLLGSDMAARADIQLLPDPTVLTVGDQRWLLSHGDQLCLSDTGYQRYRAQVHAPEWIAQFLLKPLVQRQAMAQQMRDASRTHQRSLPDYADVDADAAREWLRAANADALIHGHTHQPGDHELGGGQRRIVLSDWDLEASTPRAQALRLQTQSGELRRIDLR